MQRDTDGLPDADRAALAFSLLPVGFADEVSGLMTITERTRLREGLERVRDASTAARIEAVRVLSAEVKRGVVFPRPAAHDARDCPFNPVAAFPRQRAADVLERVAERDALQVAVTLCHLSDTVRTEIWERMGGETRTLVIARLPRVPSVSRTRTRTFAQDIEIRLTRAAVPAPVRRG